MTHPLFRISVLAVLTVLFVAPFGAAEPRQRDSSPQLLAQLWDQLAGLWGDIGCGMDPGGVCRGSSAPITDIGCGMDPHGGSCGD